MPPHPTSASLARLLPPCLRDSLLAKMVSQASILPLELFFRRHLAVKTLSPASILWRRLFILCSCALLVNLVVNLPPAATREDALLHSPALSPAPTARVTVWDAPHCVGAFATGAAPHSRLHIPYAIVRDVVVDRRPASRAALAPAPNATHRLLLYVSVHLSARLSREGSVAALTLRNASLSGVAAVVEYVMHTNHFLRRRGRYAPGDTTIFGREVTEWQVGVALHGTSPRAVTAAVAAHALLRVRLQIRRFDGVSIPFDASLPLSCALGWRLPRPIARRGSQCGARGRGASGAVLLSGSALSGARKRTFMRHGEVANFAARALMGAVQFDAVVIPVVADFSASDVAMRCGGSAACRNRLNAANTRLLDAVGTDVALELARLGVPAHLFERVVLMPSCRLGSDAMGSERGDPCRVSKRYGQYYVSFFSYAMVAPFFKWAASFEFDEFVWPAVGMKVRTRSAMEILDLADASLDGDGHMVMQWLNFKMRSPLEVRMLSERLLRGESGKLRHVANSSLSERCYYRRADGSGKSAVRCDVGVGFTIHHPVLAASGGKMLRFSQGNVQYRGLRTWHARAAKKPGMCYFDPS